MKRWLVTLSVGLFLMTVSHAAQFESRVTAAPELKAHDLNGKDKNLASESGRVVLLNFWATWCPPCQREMPSMERLRVKMKGRPLQIIAVNSAETALDVKAFLSKMKLGFPVWVDPDGSNTRRWKVFALPTSFLLDTQGRVRYVLTGPTEWNEGEALQKIESLLAEQTAQGK